MAELACVVLAVGETPHLAGAVASLRRQSEPAEIVVVRSSGNRVELPAEVRIVEVDGVPYPGATRNRGVAAARAPWIAFLAADSEAEPGWVARRLARHRAGSEAVATAVVSFHRRNVVSWASYFALNVRRMPGLPPGEALRYGVSYSRALVDGVGPFPEELRVGEDTVINRCVAERTEIVWEPGARTAHRHPTALLEMLRDQRRRGRRAAEALGRLSGLAPGAVARDALRRTASTLRLAFRYAESDMRPWLRMSVPLVPLAALAYARGAAEVLPPRDAS